MLSTSAIGLRVSVFLVTAAAPRYWFSIERCAMTVYEDYRVAGSRNSEFGFMDCKFYVDVEFDC